MTEQQRIRIVQGVLALYHRGDSARLALRLTDDVEWRLSGPDGMPGGGLRRGHEEARAAWADFAGAFELVRFEPRQFLGQRDDVVAMGSAEWSAASTGRRASLEWVMAFSLRGEKIARWRTYTDTAALLATRSGRPAVRAATAS